MRPHSTMRATRHAGALCRLAALLSLLATGFPAACQKPNRDEGTRAKAPGSPAELVACDWTEGGFTSVRADFEREFGVTVRHEPFESQEEAVAWIRSGKRCDVAVIENQLIPGLAADKLLAEIDFGNVPNFKNISANFRGLAIDPGNRHTVPCSFGTTGILVRTDLVGEPVTRWADLWSPRFAGKVAIRTQMRELVGLTLLALGHSPNSEDPRHLQEALAKLLALKKKSVVADEEPEKAVPLITGGTVWLMEGFGEDYRLARKQNPAVAYVLPAEGTFLWADNYVIPSSTANKSLAESFINFMLRPEISARDANAGGYSVPNQPARPLFKAELRDDPSAYPPPGQMQRAHFFAPLSPQGEKLYADVWSRFLSDGR